VSEWASVSDLAGLPGMPRVKRAVQKRAIRLRWPSRKRKGRGGGRDYFVPCLPVETQLALATRNVDAKRAAFERALRELDYALAAAQAIRQLAKGRRSR